MSVQCRGEKQPRKQLKCRVGDAPQELILSLSGREIIFDKSSMDGCAHCRRFVRVSNYICILTFSRDMQNW